MTITLTKPIRVGGVEVSGTQTYAADVEADLVAQGKAVWVSKPGQRTDLTLHADAHAQMGASVSRRRPAASSIYTRRQLIGERQTRATYHATFLASGDFYAVSPIVAVTRAPDDATYTNDDVYDAIAAAPTNAILTGGLPNASGGNASWTVSANQVFARQDGASTTAPVLVTGTPIACRSIPRVDGGPGRLARPAARTRRGSRLCAGVARKTPSLSRRFRRPPLPEQVGPRPGCVDDARRCVEGSRDDHLTLRLLFHCRGLPHRGGLTISSCVHRSSPCVSVPREPCPTRRSVRPRAGGTSRSTPSLAPAGGAPTGTSARAPPSRW